MNRSQMSLGKCMLLGLLCGASVLLLFLLLPQLGPSPETPAARRAAGSDGKILGIPWWVYPVLGLVILGVVDSLSQALMAKKYPLSGPRPSLAPSDADFAAAFVEANEAGKTTVSSWYRWGVFEVNLEKGFFQFSPNYVLWGVGILGYVGVLRLVYVQFFSR